MNSVPLRRLIRAHGNLGYLLVGIYLIGFWLFRFKRRQSIAVLLLALLIMPFSAWKSSCHSGMATSYTIVDLGVAPGYEHSFGLGINSRGQTAGILADEKFEKVHGFWCTSGGKMNDVGTLGGDFSVAEALNDAGQVVGISANSKDQLRGFLWKDNKMTAIGTLGGEFSTADGINNQGQVIGFSDTASGTVHAYIWQAGQMKDIGGSCPGLANGATAINENGDVAGLYTEDGETIQSFVYSGSKSIKVPSLGGDYTLASAISKSMVVGYGTISKEDTETIHGFVWQRDGIRDIGTLGGKFCIAMGVSDSGQAVGISETSKGMVHAFLWQGGQMKDLNTMLPARSGWELLSASGINAKGQIVGFGLVGNSIHAFVLTPKD